MKRKTNRLFIALLLAILICSSQDISAQIIELNGFTGIHLGGTAKLYYGDFKIEDAQNYGGKIAFGLSSTIFAELTYMRTNTEGIYYPELGSPSERIPFSSNYLHFGGLQEINLGERIAPYGTIGLGLVWWDPETDVIDGKTQFSITLGGGLKIWLTDMIGIRLQGSMFMPLLLNGYGFGCGIGTGGSGCGANVYTRITPFQGEFSGGLSIRLSPN